MFVTVRTRLRSPGIRRASLSSPLTPARSLVLRLVGRDPDPARSRDHVLLAVLAERRLPSGGPAGLASLMADLEDPPLERVGPLEVDDFLPRAERRALAAALNALLASPSLASWRQGASLDPGVWLAPAEGRTSAAIVSVAHLDEEDRSVVLGLVLEAVLAWVRGL